MKAKRPTEMMTHEIDIELKMRYTQYARSAERGSNAAVDVAFRAMVDERINDLEREAFVRIADRRNAS